MKLFFLAATIGCLLAQPPIITQPPDIDQIMSRVGRNQAQAQDARKDWIFHQKQVLRMIRGNGKLAREEHREYTITPEARSIKKHLTKFDGKYGDHGTEVAYDEPGHQYKELDIDGELINEMSDEMTNDQDSRDGIGRDLFPLTYHQQLKYSFRLKATETFRGRQVYRVAFEPKPHQHADGDDVMWKGEALIDAAEYQPVLVNTTMASKIPMAVKILLGTNLHGLGFSVAYQKFADGVWFPISYGGEFDVRAVFFYRRKISVSLVNSDFRRTEVTSNIAYAGQDR
ncbi:MAG TPA: hypothetical protein VGH38_28495 [Bryobacteraceae bacterium]|jgi:hypothetical protein